MITTDKAKLDALVRFAQTQHGIRLIPVAGPRGLWGTLPCEVFNPRLVAEVERQFILTQ